MTSRASELASKESSKLRLHVVIVIAGVGILIVFHSSGANRNAPDSALVQAAAVGGSAIWVIGQLLIDMFTLSAEPSDKRESTPDWLWSAG